MSISSQYRAAPHSKIRLDKLSTSDQGKFKDEAAAKAHTQSKVKKLGALQEKLAASGTRALLVVLQAMDGGGKDGTISHIFTGVNPQGCDVTSFKVPTPLEQRHDFLWRIHAAVPAKGVIGIFNRSHYEDVLVTRVHKTVGKKEIQRRYQQILDFEELLTDSGTAVVKFFLHISAEEQRARLQARLDTPDKHWKVSTADFKERPYWDAYQEAFADAIAATSRKHAPWYIVPSDHKWYRNAVVSDVLVDTLEKMDLKFPKPEVDIAELKKQDPLKAVS